MIDFLTRSTSRTGMTPDAVNGLFSLIRHKLAKDPAAMLPLMPQLLPRLRTLALLHDAHAAERGITGEFCERLAEIVRLAKEAAAVRS